MSTKLEEFSSEMRFLESCCLKHPVDYDVENITEVIAWERSIPDEDSGGAIFKTKDGRYGAMEESQDYTGHG